jgi:hypothetical protein
MPADLMKTIDRSRLALTLRDRNKFVDEQPEWKALLERARKSLLRPRP